MSPIQPFTISIPDSKIALLRQKLALANFSDDGTPMSDDWAYGVPVSDLKRLVAYWKEGFDWRAA